MQNNKHSFSSLTLYDHCPYCYYLGRILWVKNNWTSWHLVFGTIIHRFLEVEPNIDLSVIVEELDKVENLDGISRPELIEKAIKTAKMLIDNPLKREDGSPLVAVETEQEFFMPVEGFVLHGYIDGITNYEEILEHKTSGQKYTEAFIRRSNQHTLYEMAYRHIKEKLSNGIVYDVIYKTAQPTREWIKIQTTEQEIINTRKWFLDLATRIRNQEWKPYKQIKDRHFCNFKNLCPYCQ